MDNVYKKIPLEKLPWNYDILPNPLIDLIEKGIIKYCKKIDLGYSKDIKIFKTLSPSAFSS